MAENCLNLRDTINPYIAPQKLNKHHGYDHAWKKATLKYAIIKLLNAGDKKKISKAAKNKATLDREKQTESSC